MLLRVRIIVRYHRSVPSLFSTFFRSFFGHRPKCFLNDRKKLSHFGQNVWKHELMNTVTASFNATAIQVTKMSQRKKKQIQHSHYPCQKNKKPISPCAFYLSKPETLVSGSSHELQEHAFRKHCKASYPCRGATIIVWQGDTFANVRRSVTMPHTILSLSGVMCSTRALDVTWN